ncbi:Phenylpropionate dioxygenase and related ring-hydroxylating dioxygenases, large terminal subunit [Burkholderia singularis]|uniref:cholesterol 7-desaturase n=1 Tax=Burkholderia singularis TaxID=1503053 RepID=A0A238H641_9BURK|nr:Phenylpropionate dioxygenase and related ring-hydroxylating dioxygenases, large terminal subunit [Burkholderia singularis]
MGRYPDGWFALGYSRDVKRGAVVVKRFAGDDVVMYRTRSGLLRVIEPHCPHLGAHLGHGGVVDGENLVCPFHHLAFGPEGTCAHAPGALKPPAAMLRQRHVREWNGIIVAWYSGVGDAPQWALPDLDLSGYSVPRGRCHTLNGNLQNPAENGVDVNHFGPVHGWSNPVLQPPQADGHMMTMRSTLVLLGQPLRLDITMHGLGCMAARMELPRLGLHARVVLFPTQIEPDRWTCIELVALRVERLSSWPATIRRVAHEVLATAAYRLWFVPQFKRDLLIWHHRNYDIRPTLMAGEMAIMIFRRWASQFYSCAPDYARDISSNSNRRFAR